MSAGTGTTGAADVVIYTAPSGVTVVCKDVLLTLQGTGVSTAGVYLAPPGSQHYMLRLTTNVAGGIVLGHFVGFAVLKPGDKIRLITNLAAGGVVDVLVSGARLDGIAP